MAGAAELARPNLHAVAQERQLHSQPVVSAARVRESVAEVESPHIHAVTHGRSSHSDSSAARRGSDGGSPHPRTVTWGRSARLRQQYAEA